jgi:DNA-binding GntR family transcriptional regulator
LDEQLAAARSHDAVVARRKAADFHELVIELASNELLIEIERPLRSRMRWLLAQHDDLIAVAGQHLDLYTAIANRNALLLVVLVAALAIWTPALLRYGGNHSTERTTVTP